MPAAATRGSSELVDVVVAEMRRHEATSACRRDELRRAKDHLKGSLMLNLESTSSRMSHHARQEIYRDRADTLDEMLAAIERVSVDDVQRLARGSSPTGSLGVTVLGNVNGLQMTREQLGRLTLHSKDAEPPMIARYTHPEMGRIWSEQRRYETWLQVEVAAAEAMADAGMVPAEAARELREKGAFDIARIEEIEKVDAARRDRLHDGGRREGRARRRAGCISG